MADQTSGEMNPAPCPSSAETLPHEVEREIRLALWLGHGCEFAALYGDDGEMQCSSTKRHPRPVDFKRHELLPLVTMTIGLLTMEKYQALAQGDDQAARIARLSEELRFQERWRERLEVENKTLKEQLARVAPAVTALSGSLTADGAPGAVPAAERTERCDGRYPVPHRRDEPFPVTYRCDMLKGHDGPHGPEF